MKTRNRGECPPLDKEHLQKKKKSTDNTLNGERLNAFFLRLGTR